jgi:hypothetical protein
MDGPCPHDLVLMTVDLLLGAAENGHLEVVQLLLRDGRLDPAMSDNAMLTYVHVCCCCDCLVCLTSYR